MIVQKLHWNGQPRPRSKLDHWPELRSSDSFGIHGTGDAGDARQVLEIIVDRLELVVPGVDEQLVEPALLGLAGEQRAAHVERLLDLGRDLLQHRQAARDVEAADHHRQPGGAELAGEVERVVELVGLDADQPDQRLRAALA